MFETMQLSNQFKTIQFMNPAPKISVAYFGDNILSKEGISFLISSTPQLSLAGTYLDTEGIEEHILSDNPDVVLLEIGQSKERIECIPLIKDLSILTKVIVLSSLEEQAFIVKALKYGIDGFILDSSSPVEI